MKHAPSVITAWQRRVLSLAACLFSGACATGVPEYQVAIRPPAADAVVLEPSSLPVREVVAAEPARGETLAPLDYYRWAMAATPQELLAERLRLSSQSSPTDPLIDAVHRGVLLGMSALASPESEQAALDLLEALDISISTNDDNRVYAIFADFLLAHLRLREQLRAATANIVDTREELEAQARSNRQLQEKIAALTRLEEQLIQREQAEVQAELPSEGEQR